MSVGPRHADPTTRDLRAVEWSLGVDGPASAFAFTEDQTGDEDSEDG